MQKAILTTLSFQELTAGVKYATPPDLHKAIQERLRAGIAHFVYVNAKGLHREAYGTLEPGLMPERPQLTTAEAEDQVANKPKAENPNVQKYWDLGVQGWRHYTISKVVTLF
jgi:hypothetical protein